ncbi:hypothetical protein DL96DRAFT_1597099 [Flagelloscypha sp. PMI_526]|nr:hypothetical protein DL96DRAFT_1597099 [Flagelloscypha sp. PMI_526]
MSTPGRPPRRSFGIPQQTSGDLTPDRESLRSKLGRLSFGALQRRPSFVSRWRGSIDPNSDPEPGTSTPGPPEQAPIPAVLQAANEPYTTPLPILSMIVLSIAMLGEFLSASVATPFLLFMVKGFGQTDDEAEIAFLTGILVATFFLTQFVTSLLWAAVAERHGRRIVLTLSLLGSAVTCFAFGTASSFEEAVCIRLLQGIFGGAIGVARGSVAFVTDASNEGRAYAILGFCWGMGGVAGSIIGGTTESPALKWPDVFGNIDLFVRHPYLFPCSIAAGITFIGAFLSLFLGRDGGPRDGAIHLPPEKDDRHPPIPEEDSVPPSPLEGTIPKGFGSLSKKLSQRISGYFNKGDAASPEPSPAVPLTNSGRRTFSRTSRVNGSAYGYGSYRNRLASNLTNGTRRGSIASSGIRQRRGSNVDGLPRGSFGTGDLNFAQRLLMANENAVTNIADLWVAAAMNVDNEDPFESDTEVNSDDESLDLGEVLETEDDESVLVDAAPTDERRGSMSTVPDSPVRRFSQNRRPSGSQASRPLFFGSPRRPSGPLSVPGLRRPSNASVHEGTPATSRRYSGAVPAIFSHTGVRTPPAVLDAQNLLMRSSDGNEAETSDQNQDLEPILESRRQSQVLAELDDDEVLGEKQPGVMSVLPMMIILQYGLLALHSTTHDQIFMSYLVTDYDSGGLNLNAGHFAQLIALMFLAQIFYQFYLYPNIGPPRGRFSHLAMFRLGSLLFIPGYLTVTLYRIPFASEEEDGNFILMAALAISTALRFCGSTFAYTAISILLNYMTPPHAVGLANGIAQSIVSLARCFGPILGGLLWSVSVEGNPSGYYVGFFCVAAFCALSVLQSFMIR